MENFKTFAGLPTINEVSASKEANAANRKSKKSKLSRKDKKIIKGFVKATLEKLKKKAEKEKAERAEAERVEKAKREAEKSRGNVSVQSTHENETAKKNFCSFFRKLGDAIIRAIPKVLAVVATAAANAFFWQIKRRSYKTKGGTI